MKKIYIILFTVFGLAIQSMSAQSLGGILNKNSVSDIINTVTGNKSVDLLGTWKYTGSAVEFKSDNIIKKAGASVASSSIENKINKQLQKVGLKKDIASITFNQDSTFVMKTSEKTFNGKYTWDNSESKVNMIIIGGKSISPTVKQSGDEISLLFDGDKVLDVISFVGSKTPNSTIKSLSTLANSYDGMMVGLEMTKTGK